MVNRHAHDEPLLKADNAQLLYIVNNNENREHLYHDVNAMIKCIVFGRDESEYFEENGLAENNKQK
jgi:hypothetical protein